MMRHRFSADWFSWNIDIWRSVLDELSLIPKKVLEIGSFEGRSSTWIIENLFGPAGGELFCVDAWNETTSTEPLFDANTEFSLAKRPEVSLRKYKGLSANVLTKLISDAHIGSFDFIYVDGNHDAADVLFDLTCSFLLCGSGGLIVCDDYLWNFGDDPSRTPKLAIDSFVNCYAKKLRIVRAPLYQIFLIKN
jgi:predicted O-methyltransferase YrrM